MADPSETLFEDLWSCQRTKVVGQPSTHENSERPDRIVGGGGSGGRISREWSVEDVAAGLLKGELRNVIVLSGAGISTAAGIPDFRGGEGLYTKLREMGLESPEQLFHIDFFRQNPEAFYKAQHPLWLACEEAKPCYCHRFIRCLHERGLLLRNYTQNVDGLERKAGVPEEKLVECHGTFATAHTLDEERAQYTAREVLQMLDEGQLPRHPASGAVIKPDCVLFGEPMPARFGELAEDDFEKCDLLLIMGTSLQVAPFKLLPAFVERHVPRLLLNYEMVGHNLACDPLRCQQQPHGRDVAMLGDCDTSVKRLAELLGWDLDADPVGGQ